MHFLFNYSIVWLIFFCDVECDFVECWKSHVMMNHLWAYNQLINLL
jgi:hypothetical protein